MVTLEQLATEASKAEPGSAAWKRATEAIFRHHSIERLRSRASMNLAQSRAHVTPEDAYSQTAFAILDAIKSWPTMRAGAGYHFLAWASRAVTFSLSRYARDTAPTFYMYEKRTTKDADGVEIVRSFRSGTKQFLQPLSLDAPVSMQTNTETEMHEIVADTESISPEESAINRERIDAIESALFRAARTIRVGGSRYGERLDHTSSWALVREIMRGESAAEIARGFDFTRQWGLNTLAKVIGRAMADLRARGHDVAAEDPIYSSITERDFDRLAS